MYTRRFSSASGPEIEVQFVIGVCFRRRRSLLARYSSSRRLCLAVCKSVTRVGLMRFHAVIVVQSEPENGAAWMHSHDSLRGRVLLDEYLSKASSTSFCSQPSCNSRSSILDIKSQYTVSENQLVHTLAVAAPVPVSLLSISGLS